MAKRYFWLKFKEDFFDAEDTKLIEAMPNGKDYIIFYLKLQLKSIRTEGLLKYKGMIAYTPDMLATITNTNIDIVRSSLQIFEQLKLIEIWSDGTILMSAVEGLIGSESESAERVRRHRDKKNLIDEPLQCNAQLLQCNDQVTKCNTEKEKEIDIDLNNIKINAVDQNAFFEKIWNLYPNKKGKARVTEKQKKQLEKIGFETLSKCIDRYKKDKPEWQEFQHGSTFFTKGYVDYLDNVYKASTNTVEYKRKRDASEYTFVD